MSVMQELASSGRTRRRRLRQRWEHACRVYLGTVEVGIVIEAKTGAAGTQLLEEFLARVEMQIEPVDARLADEALICWRRFGKGRHDAGLNLGDTFSYALARRIGQPLLFVGDDFSRTDVLVG